MATIYRAGDTELERDVAVKLLRPEYERDPDFGTRFRQEARSAASLNHPNIVSVYDFGNDPAGAYIVMELIDGEDLASVIRRTGAVPPRQAARLASDVASALAAAHGRGIIHRDVKPANVLVSRDGRVKVTDFGIARAVADAQLTMPGLTMGSVHYFSPEQARGEPTTAASDVYSLGIVLYELLTGRRPWAGDSAAATGRARLPGAPPSPSGVRPGIPAALEAIVRRAMSRDPAQRYQTAGEMREALEAYLADRAPAAAAVSPVGVGVGAAAAAGAAAGGGLAAMGAARGMDAVDPISPATVATGVARPNPGRVPYEQEAYAGSYSPPRERYADAPPRRRPPEDEYDEEPRGTSPWVWISALLALAILAVVGFLVVRLLAGGGKPAVQSVTVPTFINKSFEQARSLAQSNGLVVQITNTDSTSKQPPNTVVDQDPKAGATINKGDTVNLTVAAGPQSVQVPTLVNLRESDALNLLTQNGLKAGKRSEAFDPTIPQGNVIDQTPAPGQPTPQGSTVNYTVSKGPEPTATPAPTPTPTPVPTPGPINVGDYRCMELGSQGGAGDSIEADGFKVGNVAVDAATKAINPAYAPEEKSIVVAQAPAPGTKRKPNSRIDLTVHDPSVPMATCQPG